MSATYVLKATSSDLTGGSDFTRELSTGTEATGGITVSVAKGATEDSLGFTIAGEPGSSGATGNYTVEINVTTGNTNVQLSVAVSRVNSAGAQQVISAFTTEQQATAGLKTFSLSAIDLGVWAVGDRLKVVYRFRNTNTMSAQSVAIETGTTSAEVLAPFTTPPVVVTPNTASLATAAFAPTVTASDHKVITPGTASLATTAFAPTVLTSSNVLVAPGTASIALTTFAPTVTAPITSMVGTLAVTITAHAPNVSVSSNQGVGVGTFWAQGHFRSTFL